MRQVTSTHGGHFWVSLGPLTPMTLCSWQGLGCPKAWVSVNVPAVLGTSRPRAKFYFDSNPAVGADYSCLSFLSHPVH